MKAIALALLALAATAVHLRRRRPVTVPQCDDSDIVGTPTTYRLYFDGSARTDWASLGYWCNCGMWCPMNTPHWCSSPTRVTFTSPN